MTSSVRVIVVGAGSRGEIYSQFASIHPERMKEPAVAFAKKGYHVLLEKPMATTAEDCTAIVEACTQSDVMLSVGHVLRYDPLIHKIKELIDAGVIGDVIHIQHLEPGTGGMKLRALLLFWPNRVMISTSCITGLEDAGKQSNISQRSTPSSSDVHKCVKVSSFGSVSHFRKENKPTDAADRCLDCSIEAACPYSACKIYLDRVKQVVNMEFEGGVTAAFSMVAFTEEMCKRKTTIYGSKVEHKNTVT
ncbi:hypothetical protein PAMP_011823 [Pampus punctatissimus]